MNFGSYRLSSSCFVLVVIGTAAGNLRCLSLDPDFVVSTAGVRDTDDTGRSEDESASNVHMDEVGEFTEDESESNESVGGTSAETDPNIGAEESDRESTTGMDLDSGEDILDESSTSGAGTGGVSTNGTSASETSTGETSTGETSGQATNTGDTGTSETGTSETSTEDTGSDDTTTTDTSGTSSSDTGSESCVPELCLSKNVNSPMGFDQRTGSNVYAVPISLSENKYIARVEYPTGLVAGTSTIEIWDNSGQYPGQWIGGNDFEITSNLSWQGADLLPRIPVTAGVTYWILWYTLNNMRLPVGDSGQTVNWRWSTNKTTPFWTGAAASPWMYRVYCCDTPD